MIADTDQSLEDSRGLLESIRSRARTNAESIDRSSDLLRRQFDELGATGKLIEQISAGFMDNAERFKEISGSAVEQQARLDEVGTGMGQIDESAGDLNRAAEELLENVDRIVRSQARLREVLEARSG